MGSPKIALTIDLEEWFTVQNFFDHFSRDEWDSKELRSTKSTLKLLDLFDKHHVKATFFVLGWVAERTPDILQEIVERGHEIASHGYGHEMVKKNFKALSKHGSISRLQLYTLAYQGVRSGYKLEGP